MTMTFPLLNRARRIVFLAAGKEKATVLRDVLRHGVTMNGTGAGALPASHPAQRIALDEGRLVWLVDQAAASALDTEPVSP